MTAIRTFIGRQDIMSGNPAIAKILFSYLASHLTALAVIGLFYLLGLFDGGIFSGHSPLMQLLNL